MDRPIGVLRLPDGVIGRGDVLVALERNFASLPESSRRFVLLEGASGVGKSTVLREMRRRVLATGGLVASADFGAGTRPGPSSGLRGAIGDIVGTMLGLPDDDLHGWLFDLRQALGGPVEHFADLIPELALLPGHDVATLGASPTGLRNRLRLAVLAVVRATARPTRPLLDHPGRLRRGDGESMQIVHDVITGDADGLLVIAAAKSGALVGQPVFDDPTAARVRLEELDRDALDRFVGATLGTDADDARELTTIIAQRVGAIRSPSSSSSSVPSRCVLTRPDPLASWEWHESTMRALDPAPTEQDIAASLLREFEGTDVLEAAACLGESFTISDLSCAAGRSSDEVAETILHALDRGIIRRRAATEPSSVFLDPSDAYSFVHERVANAVRSQVAPDTQIDVHDRFGARCCSPMTPTT